MNRFSAFVTVCFFVGVLAFVLWIGTQEGAPTGSNQQIVTTIYPTQFFAQRIIGEHAEVVNVIPAGVEPHDYEPTPRDITRLLAAKVLIVVGGGLDEWVEEMVSQVKEEGAIVRVLDQEMEFFVLAEGEDNEDEEEREEHHHEGMDPHFWTDPLVANEAVAVILQALIEADPAHETDYRANAQQLTAQLQDLHEQYLSGLARCEKDSIVVSHDAFGYLARRYGLDVHAISGLSPEEEPSVRDLAELARTAEELEIDTIFFETLVSPELAETLASEIGAKTAILNPLEGLSEEEVTAGADYFSIMEANLGELQAALVCQK